MASASFTVGPAHLTPVVRQAEAFTAAFSDYVTGPVSLDGEGMARYFFGQAVELWLSRLALSDEHILGFGYINRTGEIARLAGMGFVPEARGRRIGSGLLGILLDQARARGERLMTLEVFEQNPPAVALYQKFGFHNLGRLLGWQYEGRAQEQADSLTQISLLDAAARSSVFEYPQAPWQISRHALLKLPPLSRAYALGDSLVAVTNPEAEKPAIRMVNQAGNRADWTQLRRALAALLAQFPDRRWSVPAIFPEMFGRELFEPLGFRRESLNQFHMELTL